MNAPTVIPSACAASARWGRAYGNIFERSPAELESRLGVRLELARASVRDWKEARREDRPARLTTDALAVANDPSIHIVCELMGGTILAREVTLAALRAGKVVVSANKALICEHGAEIIATAQKHGGHFFFEAVSLGAYRSSRRCARAWSRIAFRGSTES